MKHSSSNLNKPVAAPTQTSFNNNNYVYGTSNQQQQANAPKKKLPNVSFPKILNNKGNLPSLVGNPNNNTNSQGNSNANTLPQL
jgi:hypothetical protein